MGEPPEPNGPVRERAGGDLIVLVVLAAGIVAYCVDAIRASTALLNLILVLPLSIAALLLCLAQFLISLRESRARGPATASSEAPAGAAPRPDIVRVTGLFTVYVLTLPWLGFDVGTMLFIAAYLWTHGERRWTWLLGYSIGFGLLTALFFSRMLPYPMPTLVLGAA